MIYAKFIVIGSVMLFTAGKKRITCAIARVLRYHSLAFFSLLCRELNVSAHVSKWKSVWEGSERRNLSL